MRWIGSRPWRISHWLQFWSGYVRCPLGWHQWWVIYITDGRTTIRCAFCKKRREPTAKEKANHPDADFTPEQQAAQNAKIEEIMAWLKEKGYRG